MIPVEIDTSPIGIVAADLMEMIEAAYPGSVIRAAGVVVEIVSADDRISTIHTKTNTGIRRDSRSLFQEASDLYKPDANQA